ALVAGRRIECDRRPKIAPRQLGGPAEALGPDRIENCAAAFRPTDDPDAVGPDIGLRLQIEECGVRVARPLLIKLAVKARLGAHLAVIARPETFDHQHDVTAPIKVAGPSALAGLDQSARSAEKTAAPVQEHHRGAPLSAGRSEDIAIERGRGEAGAIVAE